MTKAFYLHDTHAPSFSESYQVLQSAVLNRTSLEGNNNKFYVLEVHEADGVYRVFTHYGRVGTEGVREARYTQELTEALAEYHKIYAEKTGPRKGYVPIEIEKATVGSQALRAETEKAFAEKRGVKESELAPEIAQFVDHIYDETKAELVRRIETPLGSLSQNQIERGAEMLRALRFAITRGHTDQVVPLTSRYYSLVPHRLGRWSKPEDVAIGTIEQADSEEELLQLMRDVYHVQSELESEVDRKYRALGATLSVVSRDDPQYTRLERKILETQSQRHCFGLRVKRIFSVCLPAERARYDSDGLRVGNVQQLFHGTKNANMVGILTRGLLIAPKNVPVTGYMFGKGVYFADQSTKSAQYSLRWANNQKPFGYLFLADVALGKIKQETGPQYREEAPRGYHSVQGCKGQHLIHNEFIVYKTAQCTLRYIAEIEQA